MNNFKEMLDNVIMDAYAVQRYLDDGDEDQYSSALIKLTENSRKIVSEIEELRSELKHAWKCGIVVKSGTKMVVNTQEVWDNMYRLIDELEQAREALKRVEWLELYVWTRDVGRIECPWCGNLKSWGHAPDCKRQKALGVER